MNKRGERIGFGAMSSNGTSVRGFGAMSTASAAVVHIDLETIDVNNITDEQRVALEAKMRAEKGDEYVEKLKAGTLYNGACPLDPFEKVMCEGCQ